jgi:hypothetical protein
MPNPSAGPAASKKRPRTQSAPTHRNAPDRARVVKQLWWSDTSTFPPSRERVQTVAQRGLFVRNVLSATRALKKPQLPGPICKRQAQPFHIGMARPQQSFDFRKLPAAAFDSPLPPFDSDLLERAPVAFQSCLLAGVLLPTLHNHVGIARV